MTTPTPATETFPARTVAKTQTDLSTITVLGHQLANLRRAAILAIGGIKGGIGKSTTAIFLAYCYALLGLKVLVLDADPASGSSRKWYRHAKSPQRNDPLPFDVQTHPSEDLEERIVDEGWAEQYHLIIIDTGGHNDSILRRAYEIADYLLLMASPSPADIDTFTDTAKATVGSMGARGIPETLLITAVKSQQMAREAKNKLRGIGVEVLTKTISHSVNYQHSYGWCPESPLEYEEVRYELEKRSAA